MIKERLIEIIKELKEVTLEELNVSNEVIFQEACSFLRGELSNENWLKNNSWKFLPSHKQEGELGVTSDKPLVTSNSPPATEGQIKAMKKHGIKFSKDTTKEEAGKLIEESMRNRK